MNSSRRDRNGLVSPATFWSAAGLIGCAALLGLLAWDAIGNVAPGDAPARPGAPASAPASADAEPALFPQSVALAEDNSADCVGRGGGALVTEGLPAVRGGSAVATDARPIGDRTRWLTSIDYPLSALRQNHEGVADVSLAIDRRGRPSGCTLIASSGDAALDAAACTTLQLRARFTPARDAAGCPTPTTFRQRVRWQIPVN